MLLVTHLLATVMLGIGAWVMLSASIVVVSPEVLALSDVLAACRFLPEIARHTRPIAILLALLGLLLFVAGTMLGVSDLA